MAGPHKDAHVTIRQRVPGTNDVLLAVVALVVGVALALFFGIPDLAAPPMDVSADPAGFLAPF